CHGAPRLVVRAGERLQVAGELAPFTPICFTAQIQSQELSSIHKASCVVLGRARYLQAGTNSLCLWCATLRSATSREAIFIRNSGRLDLGYPVRIAQAWS